MPKAFVGEKIPLTKYLILVNGMQVPRIVTYCRLGPHIFSNCVNNPVNEENNSEKYSILVELYIRLTSHAIEESMTKTGILFFYILLRHGL